MTYQQQYNDLIFFAKLKSRRKLNRSDPNYCYYEEHHIIPKCFFKSEGGHLDGDKDHPDNLVLLTPEEHFDAHQLLALIYPKHGGLLSAAINMSGKNITLREEYGELKRKYSQQKSLLNSGTNNPFYGRGNERLGENNPNFGNPNNYEHSQDVKDKISFSTSGENNPFYGRKHTKQSIEQRTKSRIATGANICKDETKLKLSIINSNPSIETRQKMSKSRLGKKRGKYKKNTEHKRKPYLKIMCPHCGIIGRGGNMKRYHFDNCKHKI